MFPQKTEMVPAVWAVIASLLFWAPASLAELADREQPINMEADRVTVDDVRHISTFTGNVRFSQGSLLILGDTVLVTQDQSGFVHVEAHGKTASFREKREAEEGYVEGYAERIEYNSNSEILFLDVHARLKRAGDEVTGEHITYNVKTELFRVNVSDTDQNLPPQQRVRVILQPKSKQGAAATPDKTPAKAGDNVTPGK